MKTAFSDLFGCEVWVLPVSTGTAANSIALSALTPPYGTILCSETAHIQTSECGATELFSGGAKLTHVPAESGRMSADVLNEVIRKAGKGLQHRAQPAAVSLTIGTERGTVYPVSEIARIAEVTRQHGLHFHIDGARLANALVTLGTSVRSVTTELASMRSPSARPRTAHLTSRRSSSSGKTSPMLCTTECAAPAKYGRRCAIPRLN